MSFTVSIKYLPQLDPTTFELQDTSVYTAPDAKSNFTARTLNILQADDTPLPGYPNPINFPIGGSNPDIFTIAGLTADVALQIIMTLTPVTPNGGSVYVAEADIATTRFLQQGLFNIQVQKNNSPLTSSLAAVQYRNNSSDLIIETQNSQTALLYADFTASQAALNRGEQIITNTQL
jgi:hypothetical protein